MYSVRILIVVLGAITDLCIKEIEDLFSSWVNAVLSSIPDEFAELLPKFFTALACLAYPNL